MTRRAGAAACAALGLVLLALSLVHAHGVHVDRAERTRLLAETGLDRRRPDLAHTVVGEPDPVHARLEVARALLAEAFDPSSLAKLTPRGAAEEAGRAGERLELALHLARSAERERPASWQAPMIVGGATYRLWSMHGDPRLFRERDAWEQPLLRAARLAPAEDEPLRLLAAGRLETWPALGAEERAATRDVLRRAFADPATFARLAPLWLAVARGEPDAMSLVPDEPAAWRLVEDDARRRGDWAGMCGAHLNWLEQTERSLTRRVAEAEARARGGDPVGARAAAASVIGSPPRRLRFLPLVERALLVPTSGPHDPSPALRAWLAFALDRAARGEPGMNPHAADRLAAALSDLDAPTRALALLAGGQRREAELLEARSEGLNTEAWAPYLLLHARVLAAERRVDEARRELGLVHRSWRGTPVGIEARRVVAEAAGDAAGATVARAELAALAAGSWPATAWRWSGGVPRLDVMVGTDARGLAVAFDPVPAGGAAVEVVVDGATAACLPVVPDGASAAIVRVAFALPTGAHSVEVLPIAGRRVVPGAVDLIR